MDCYTIYCDKEQSKIAYLHGAPLHMVIFPEDRKEPTFLIDKELGEYGVCPTAEQMCEWLRDVKGIHIWVEYDCNLEIYRANVLIGKYDQITTAKINRDMALLTAIEIALRELGKKEVAWAQRVKKMTKKNGE